MDSQNSKINILIVGATGTLGSLITKYCLLKPNLIVNILVRDPQKNKELTSQIENAGGRVIKGDVTQPETLKGVTKGMHTVIFTLPSYGDNVIYTGQVAVIDDCIENKVERIVPAEFASNTATYPFEGNKPLTPMLSKINIRKYLKSLPVKTLHINAGLFIDFFYPVVLSKDFEYWGDDDFKLQVTSYDDTAKFAAAAIADKDRVGDATFVANEISVKEAVEVYNKVRGTNFTAKRAGSLEDLKAKGAELEKQGDPAAGPLRVGEFLFDERSKFSKVNNSEFPEIKPTSVEEFLRQRPDIKVREADSAFFH